MIKMLFKKTILFALVAALGVASLPLVSASAAGVNDPTVPPKGAIAEARLELIWARQLRIYNGMGKADEFEARVQTLIDRAKENGKDVADVQTALDAFEAAVQNANPIYESMDAIVSAHEGFDSNGKVTDAAKARETVQAMMEKFKAIHDAMDGAGKALREAIKAFREANPRPVK